MYLISALEKFTKQSLMVYKSIDVWLYFRVGFINKINVMRTPMIFLLCLDSLILSLAKILHCWYFVSG